MDECNEKGSWQGHCCCNCKWQKTIVMHPWNKEPFKGSISDTFGVVCTVPDLGVAVFSDRGHGMCEMHTQRDENG